MIITRVYSTLAFIKINLRINEMFLLRPKVQGVKCLTKVYINKKEEKIL